MSRASPRPSFESLGDVENRARYARQARADALCFNAAEAIAGYDRLVASPAESVSKGHGAVKAVAALAG